MTTSYIDNGLIRVGVATQWGGAINYMSRLDVVANVVDAHDSGRLIQQALYGGISAPNGGVGTWDSHPGGYWWNPLSGGDIYNNGSVIDIIQNNGDNLYVRTLPIQWEINNVLVPNCVFEQWITLSGLVVICHMRFTWTGSQQIIPEPSFKVFANYGPDEWPATYCLGQYNRCKWYEGSSPWTNDPALTTKLMDVQGDYSGFDPTEPWSALVNSSNFGLGMYFPGRPAGTRGSWVSFPDQNSMYMAPRNAQIFDPNSCFDYYTYFTIGDLSEIRSTIYNLHTAAVTGGAGYVAALPLAADNGTVTPSGTTAELIGVLSANSATVTPTSDPAELILVNVGGGSIRSPSGQSLPMYNGSGQPLTIYRYVNGTWQ